MADQASIVHAINCNKNRCLTPAAVA